MYYFTSAKVIHYSKKDADQVESSICILNKTGALRTWMRALKSQPQQEQENPDHASQINNQQHVQLVG